MYAKIINENKQFDRNIALDMADRSKMEHETMEHIELSKK
jgi:hypothetical protein